MARKIAPLKFFCSYTHSDEEGFIALRKHLMGLERSGKITLWHDRKITGSTVWGDEIERKMAAADVVLLFISPDFVDSPYCLDVETKRALQRWEDS